MRDKALEDTPASDRVDLITKGDLRRAILVLALPAMAMMLGNLLFEIVDMFWVGKTSVEGIAAVAVASFIIWALKALANIVSVGTTALISMCAGGREWERLSGWFRRGLFLALVYALALIIAGLTTLDPVTGYMGLEEEVREMAKAYLAIFYISLPIVFLFAFFDNIFRSRGDTLTPATITALSLTLNAVLDPVLIFGLQGAPQLGVAGAALASAISQSIGLALFMWRLRKEGLTLGLPPGLLGMESLRSFAQITRVGAPTALTSTLLSLLYILLTRIVSQFGTDQIAAMGVGQRWEGLAYFAAMATSTTVATMVGQNLGAGNPARARKAAGMATGYLMAFTAVVSLIFIFGGGSLASALTSDPAVVEATRSYLRIIGYFEFFTALEMGLEGAFIGSGNTLPPFFISVPLTVARVPVAWYTAQTVLGIDAVWWTISISTLIKGVLMAAWFSRGRWAEPRVKI